MAPAFRMHVRAHGTVAKFFRALHDATKDQVSEFEFQPHAVAIFFYFLTFNHGKNLWNLQ